MEHTRFVGLDIHKERISIAVAESGRTGAVEYLSEISNDPVAIVHDSRRGHARARGGASRLTRSIWLSRLGGAAAIVGKTRRLLTNRPCLGFVYEESHSKRTSTRQQLDCAKTL